MIIVPYFFYSSHRHYESIRKKKNKVSSLIRYQWIVRNLPFFLFLAFLAVIYIYNGHYADRVVRDIGKTGRELQELQYEFKSLKSEVMFRSKQSELAKAVEPFGLKPCLHLPWSLATV